MVKSKSYDISAQLFSVFCTADTFQVSAVCTSYIATAKRRTQSLV